jgi:glycosyltransferase involved in cell wall biosynthesis
MKNNNFSKTSKIDILFVSNFVPSIGDGASTYILSILEYLSNENFNVHYISTGLSIKSWINLFLLSSNTQKILFKSLSIYLIFFLTRPLLWKEYFKSFLFFLYSSLPIPIKKNYRSIKRSLLKLVNINFEDDSDINPRLIKINPNLYDVIEKETVLLIQQETEKICPQVIIANYVWMAYALEFGNATSLKVIITHDLMHERFASFQEHHLLNAETQLSRWDQKTEIEALSKANLLLAIQEDEAKILKKLLLNTEVLTIPIAINAHSSISEQVKGRCLFIGSQAKQNFYNLNWFLNEIWEKVLEKFPSAELNICGGVCTWFKKDYQNVNFKGIVPDLSLEYSQAQVCIIPNLVGSGLKIKLIEALSYGKACVSTSIGLQGLTKLSNEVVLLADDPDDFCQAILELLTNNEKREKIESLAKDYVINNLSPDIVYAPLVDRFYQHINKLKN